VTPYRLGDEILDLGADADVRDHVVGESAFGLDLLHRLPQFLGVPPGDDHLRALPGERRRRGPADPGASPGDQDDLAAEPLTHFGFFLV
jgi:hypothetical protein